MRLGDIYTDRKAIFDVYCEGDIARHDEMVREELYRLAEEVDVIAFAQVSMSKVEFDADKVKVPVCMIGTSGFERIYSMMK